MNSQVWKTLFTDDLDLEQYLYHYTTIDKAIKVIHSQQLWFSNLTNLNDTTESKLRIKFVRDKANHTTISDERTQKVKEYLSENNEGIRLLCFSMDRDLPKKEKQLASTFHKNHEKDKYFDVTGRGFALPRMWAQYGSNHQGVCFVINKKSFDKALQKLTYCRQSKVSYKSFYKCFEIEERRLNILYSQLSNYYNGNLSFFQLLNSDDHFVKYNYFSKQKDWENEREYRYISFIDHKLGEEIKIDGLFSFLEGIVIGEKIDPAYENVIKQIVDKRCDIKKIFFRADTCELE